MPSKNNTILALFVALIWFILISVITAQTEYQSILADRIADPRGTSTQLESIISILVVVVTFIPSGLLIAYPYVISNFKNNLVLRSLILSVIIAVVLWVPFSWYNFATNF